MMEQWEEWMNYGDGIEAGVAQTLLRLLVTEPEQFIRTCKQSARTWDGMHGRRDSYSFKNDVIYALFYLKILFF